MTATPGPSPALLTGPKLKLVSDVDPRATTLSVGAHLTGSGDIWLDGATLEVVSNNIPTTDDLNTHLHGPSPNNFTAVLDPTVQRNGHPTLCISSTNKVRDSWCWYGESNHVPDKYQGHRIRLTAWIKTQAVTGVAHLAVWSRSSDGQLIRLDRPDTRTPLKGTNDWTKCELIADIPLTPMRFDPGFNLAGTGKAWIDDLHYELIPDDDSSL
jgi:hypothetical protein